MFPKKKTRGVNDTGRNGEFISRLTCVRTWAASNTTMTDEIKMDVRERGLDRYRGNHEDLDGLIIKDASIMVMMIHGR